MGLEELGESLRKAADDGMVKIGIPHDDDSFTEWCWATPVSRSHARLANVCMAGDVGWGDIVQFEELPETDGGPHDVLKAFVRVVTRGSTQCGFVFATDKEAKDKSPARDAVLHQRWRTICDTLKCLPEGERPLCVEGMGNGFGIAAFDTAVTPSRAVEILAACPGVLKQFT